MYAIYQQGYAVFGVGESPTIAAEDALEWINEPFRVVRSQDQAEPLEWDWTLYAPDDSEPLGSGNGEPSLDDRIHALVTLCERGRRGGDGDLILVECSSALAERVATEGGDQVVELYDGVLRLVDELGA